MAKVSQRTCILFPCWASGKTKDSEIKEPGCAIRSSLREVIERTMSPSDRTRVKYLFLTPYLMTTGILARNMPVMTADGQ